ncbi:MAG: hypothetical protein QGD90_11335, partial [Candidatus Hydrogenedentes bacterium]|nr:hypothetical protein [Candidatus Hydrogenedentota bacterium]
TAATTAAGDKRFKRDPIMESMGRIPGLFRGAAQRPVYSQRRPSVTRALPWETIALGGNRASYGDESQVKRITLGTHNRGQWDESQMINGSCLCV